MSHYKKKKRTLYYKKSCKAFSKLKKLPANQKLILERTEFKQIFTLFDQNKLSQKNGSASLATKK